MDHILVFVRDQAEHDAQVIAVLEQIEKAGVTLNKRVNFRKFWFHRI